MNIHASAVVLILSQLTQYILRYLRMLMAQGPAQPHTIEAIQKSPKTIFVFEGGGAKGLVYAGALKMAQMHGLLKPLEKVAGSSAGGITAFLVATGHTAEEIEKVMMELDLTEIQDSKPAVQAFNSTANFVNDTAKYAVPVYGLTRYAIGKELPLQMGDAGSLLHNVIDSCYGSGEFNGAWQGEKFIALARGILKAKTGLDKITFKELHELKIKHPELGLKDLYLTGTEVETGESVVFSHENPEMQDVDIVDALRATMSFPFAFKAHEIIINGKLRKFIDGGVKNNYPMNIFDLTNESGQRVANPAVLGFKVDDSEECQTLLFKEGIPNKEKRIGNFKAISQDGDVYKYYRHNTVQIYDADVWTLNFDLDELTKLILKLSGEESMKDFIAHGYQSKSMHDNELINTLMKLGSDLNNGDYSDAQKALMFLQSKYPQISKQVSQIVIKLMKNFNMCGLRPGATEGYAALIKVAYENAQEIPEQSRFLPALRDGLCAGAAVGGGLLAAGALNVVTGGAPILVAGTLFGIRMLTNRKTNTTPAVQGLYDKIDVKAKITGHYFKEAYELIKANIAALSLEEITELKQHLNGLKSKGVWNQVRAEYDTLNNYLDVERKRLHDNVDTDALVESFEKIALK